MSRQAGLHVVLLLLGALCTGWCPAVAQGLKATPQKWEGTPAAQAAEHPGPGLPSLVQEHDAHVTAAEATRAVLLAPAFETDGLLAELDVLYEAHAFIERMITFRGEGFSVSVDPLKPRCTLQIRLSQIRLAPTSEAALIPAPPSL